MSIYTRRGDTGETSLGDGSRTSKASERIEALGAIDEANSAIGFARCVVDDEWLDERLRFVQHSLFSCAGSLATPCDGGPTKGITDAGVSFLESSIDSLEERTSRLTGFVLPAGSEAATRLHLARTAVRRAERRVSALPGEAGYSSVLAFMNRLSDMLFAAARYANARGGTPDECWDPDLQPPA